MTVFAARGNVVPRGVPQLGVILIEACGVEITPLIVQRLPQPPALRCRTDSQQHSGGAVVPFQKAQNQPAANGSQQHTCQPRQPRAGGKHCPEVHQKLRDGHGEQRVPRHGDGVAARGDKVEHQHDNARDQPIPVRGKKCFCLAKMDRRADERQHDGQRCAKARIDDLLPAGSDTGHEQVDHIRAAEVSVGVARKVDGKCAKQKQLGQRGHAKCSNRQHRRRKASLLQGAAHRVSHKHKTDHRQIIEVDACAQQPHAAPDKAGAAARGHELVTAQPKVECQQHKPVGGQRRVGKHADRKRRKQHEHARAQHAAPQLGGLAGAHDDGGLALVVPAKCGLYARNAGNDRLRQPALQGIAEQPPPAEILEPRGQNPAQQLKEQRRQRQRVREQHAGAERVDRVVIRADVGQMHRAAAEKLPPQIVLDRVGAQAVQDPVNARRVKHPHAVNSQKDQHPQQCAGQRPAVFFQCFHLTFSGQRSWTAWWTSSRPSSGSRRRGAAPSRWGRFPRRAGCATAQCR